VGGFFGELYRLGASLPIEYEDGSGIKTCRLSPAQIKSEELRVQFQRGLDVDGELAKLGHRMKFPAKSGDLARRWCSAYLKIIVADTVIRDMFPMQDGMTTNLEPLRQGIKILVVSGERRGESTGRATYNEMEVHRINATAKACRLVHQWRAVIDHSERDVWEISRRHCINPHPAYVCGWGRCSCACCVFSLPKHWAGIKELFPDIYREFREDEIRLGFMLDYKKNLDEYIAGAASCVYYSDGKALKQLVTGRFPVDDIYCKPGEWRFPSGAFQGGQGGPC
jgi:3'-phosphoadenosine 5'-phosphosulfate sulfotransferase (PAPS reductase)/FAD synthetase